MFQQVNNIEQHDAILFNYNLRKNVLKCLNNILIRQYKKSLLNFKNNYPPIPSYATYCDSFIQLVHRWKTNLHFFKVVEHLLKNQIKNVKQQVIDLYQMELFVWKQMIALLIKNKQFVSKKLQEIHAIGIQQIIHMQILTLAINYHKVQFLTKFAEMPQGHVLQRVEVDVQQLQIMCLERIKNNSLFVGQCKNCKDRNCDNSSKN
ncbi:unnamed protein product [Paramecium primaurelia]|uniref:Uncharacterized protein n=1 Tax=Paramecium primaurelia TaxID=5886 RepID=A0A8S1QSS5_PARPR|nr:unnamed protein product [Paramecium primaurelia]